MILKILERYPYSGTGVAVAGTITSFIDQINSVLQCASLLVAIFAGLTAIAYHKNRMKNDSKK